jgi:NAD(P)H dehydrogenase (quinone)
MSHKVLIMGPTGDTGGVAVRESIKRGLHVRALVHSKDVRSEVLAKLGAEVVVGDLLDIDTVREAMEGVDAAYLVYPVRPGLLDATLNFAQAAKEAGSPPSSTYPRSQLIAIRRVSLVKKALLLSRSSIGRDWQ